MDPWGNFKALTLDFEWFSLEVHRELDTKTVSNFPHVFSSPAVTSQVLFPTIFPDRSTFTKDEKEINLILKPGLEPGNWERELPEPESY